MGQYPIEAISSSYTLCHWGGMLACVVREMDGHPGCGDMRMRASSGDTGLDNGIGLWDVHGGGSGCEWMKSSDVQ